MVGLLLLALGVVAPAQDLTPPPLPPRVPLFEVVVRRQSDKGEGTAGNSGVEPFESYIHAAGCGIGASGRPPLEPQGTGWHIKGEIVGRDNDVLTVKVEWQRMFDDSRWLDAGPHGSQQLTMKIGERVVLDQLPEREGSCGDVRLEAGVITRAPWQMAGRGSAGAVRTGQQAMQAVMAARASAGGAGVGARVGSGGGFCGNPPCAPMKAGPDVDLELWLIETWPDGSGRSARLPVRAGWTEVPFKFEPMIVYGERGKKATIEVSGKIRSIDAGSPRLSLMIDRRVVIDGENPMETSGNSLRFISMPSTTDVIGIELPMAPKAAPYLSGHQFSIRLRLVPKK